MASIALFSDLPDFARGVARILADRGGFTYVSDDDLIKEAASKYSKDEKALYQALECQPGLMQKFCSTGNRDLFYIEAVLAERLLQDNTVFSGFVGYPLMGNVSHVMKVRLLCGIKDIMELSKLTELSEDKLESGIENRKAGYRKWVESNYGLDTSESSLYDITLNVGNLSLEETIDSILHAAKHERFQPMTYSLECVRDQIVSSRVRVHVSSYDPKAEIRSRKGHVYVYTRGSMLKRKEQARKLKEELIRLDGVQQVEVYNKKEMFECVACGH